MPRYKPYDVNQVTLIPVLFPDQILPGSFDYTLNEIVDEHSRRLAEACQRNKGMDPLHPARQDQSECSMALVQSGAQY